MENHIYGFILAITKIKEGKGDEVYKILITKELKSESYSRFINYAFCKSDAFMLVTYRNIGDIELMFNKPIDLSLSKDIQELILKSNEEAKKRKYKNMDIFKKNTEPFLEKLKPYIVKKRNFPTEWPGVKVILNKYTNVDICVYRICEEIKTYLLEPKGLFNWKYPYFPDDLSLFNKGYCWFTTVAHERYACMYVDNDEEIKILKELGVEFQIIECSENEGSLFYEEYNL